jgi:hypothetical protein
MILTLPNSGRQGLSNGAQGSHFPGFPEGIYLHLRLVEGMILKVAI